MTLEGILIIVAISNSFGQNVVQAVCPHHLVSNLSTQQDIGLMLTNRRLISWPQFHAIVF